MTVSKWLRRLLTEPVWRRRLLAGLIPALLSPLPLVGTFGYESSLVLTAPLSLLGLGAGVDAVREARAKVSNSHDPSRSFLGIVGPRMLREVLVLVGLVLAVLIVAQLWNTTCEPLTGLAFFCLGPGLSAGLGAVCGLWGATVVRRNARRRQIAAGLVPMVASLVIALHRLFVDPVVFAHDPFWGYFAGPLYDEAVGITPRYLWFRAYNVAAALAAALALDLVALPSGTLGSLRRVVARPWSLAAFGLLTVVSASFGLRPEHHHWNATVDSLSVELPGTLRTEHFVIHYDPASAAARELDLIEAEHEFAWHRLAAKVGREPEVPVHSFVFPDAGRKRMVMGAGRTEVSPPWRGHLYLNDTPFPHRVLHHELAHSFSAPLGDPLLGISATIDSRGIALNLALVEGFAEALAQRPRVGLDLHDQAAVLHRLDKRPELASIMGLSFWGKSSRHAYAAAGSFCLWLAETRGVDALSTLYGSAGDFELAYGVPLAELEKEWIAFLQARPIRDRDIEAQRQRYRRPAIFQRPCAHRTANLRAEASKAQARGDHRVSLANLETVCSLEPHRARHRIALGTAQARAGQPEDARATLEEVARDPDITHTLASAIDQHLGDLATMRGDLEQARAHYREALSRSVSDPVARALQIKELGTHDPRLAPLLMDYFVPFEPSLRKADRAATRIYVATEVRDLDGYAPLGSYLVGRQLLATGQGARAAEAFERALSPADGEHPLPTAELRRAAREGLLDASVRRRDYGRAREVLRELEDDPEIGNGDRYTYRLWSERIEFFREYRPAP